jgi:hypothetical protein
MSTVEKFLMGALFVVALFIMVNPQNKANEVITAIANGLSNVFGTLQGRQPGQAIL